MHAVIKVSIAAAAAAAVEAVTFYFLDSTVFLTIRRSRQRDFKSIGKLFPSGKIIKIL